MIDLKDSRLFVLIMTCLLCVSCEIDKIEKNQFDDFNDIVTPSRESLTYNFRYRDILFSENEWNDYVNSIENPNFSMIGINQNFYVFDSKEEAKKFENGEFKQKLSELQARAKITTNATKGDILLGSANITYSINIFDHTDYNETNYIKYYRNHYVQRWKPNNLFGDFYLTGNEFETNLPTTLRKKVSSCQMEFVKGGSVLISNGSPVYLMCKIYLNAGLLEDNSRLSFVTILYKGNNTGGSTRNISDFGDYRMWSVFGIPDWDNKIQSIQVKIF